MLGGIVPLEPGLEAEASYYFITTAWECCRDGCDILTIL